MRTWACVATLAAAIVSATWGCEKKSTEGADATPPPLTLTTSTPAASTSTPPSTQDASTQDAAAQGPIVDLVVGTGAEATSGKKVTVHYTLWLANGMKRIESSYDKKKPYSFRLGAGGVIKGWDEGIVGMRVGGKRRLTVPPQLGYGAAGSPPSIPGNATLVFEIELLDVR